MRLYVKSNLNVNILFQFNVVNDVGEILVAEICVDKNKCMLCCLYHPSTADHGNNYDFSKHCCYTLKLLRDLGVPVIVCGDFNLNMFNLLRLNYISYYVDNMLEMGYHLLITVPTKYNPKNQITKYSLIDQFWVSSPGIATGALVVPIEITDYYPASAGFAVYSSMNSQNRITRAFIHSNNVKITSLLMQIMPDIINNDTNQTFDSHYSRVFEAYEISYPKEMKAINKKKKW